MAFPAAAAFVASHAGIGRHENTGCAVWLSRRQLLRTVPLLTVAAWWSLCDQFPRSMFLNYLQSYSPRPIWFVVTPAASVALAGLLVHAANRRILAQQPVTIDIARLTTWSVLSRTVPLLIVALGVDSLPQHVPAGVLWLASAALMGFVAGGRLRSAEGFKPSAVKSGELHKRAFVLAKQMGVRLKKVYVVPSGRNHITNAFGGLSRIGVSDDYGKWLKGSQLDFVIAHELAHLKQSHWLKDRCVLIGSFALMAGLGLGLPYFSSTMQIGFRFLVIFVPLLGFYFLSRRFEYEADRIAAVFTRDADAAIHSLTALYKYTETPTNTSIIAELFSTHPALSRRLEAIRGLQQLHPERQSSFARHV